MMHTYLSCDTLFLGQEIEQWDKSSLRSIHCLLCMRLSVCSVLSNQLRSDCMYHSRGTKCDNVMISFYSCVSIYSDVVRFYSPRVISTLKSRKQQLHGNVLRAWQQAIRPGNFCDCMLSCKPWFSLWEETKDVRMAVEATWCSHFGDPENNERLRQMRQLESLLWNVHW